MFPVDAQITACAPSRNAAETAQVIPRSLNEPVGFAPSSFSQTSVPARSETRGAGTSGVEPSLNDTTGSSGPNGRRSRYRSISPVIDRSMSERPRARRPGRGRDRSRRLRPSCATTRPGALIDGRERSVLIRSGRWPRIPATALETLSERALNRALLARQMLLARRSDATPEQAVEPSGGPAGAGADAAVHRPVVAAA